MLRLSRRQAIRTVTLNTVALNLALAATAALPGGETAEAASWHATGLGGLPVSLIALDRSAPGVIYAAVHGGGRSNLRKTANGGQTWVALERGLPAGIQPTALAVSPDEGRVVLVAGVDGLFRSTSGGATWTDVRQPLPTVTALLFDGANPHIALAGTELRGNFRSTDGGRTWRPAHLGLSRDRYGATPGAVRLAQHPTEPRTIYMGTNGFAGVYKSEDGGQSWQSASNGLSSPIILALAVNPAAPDVLLAVTGKGLTRSSDGGGSWQAVDSLPAIDPVAVQFEPEAKETIYVASERGPLYRSTNGGSTWVELPSLPRPVRTLTTWPAARAPMLAAGAGEGLWQLALPPTLPASPEPPGRDRQYFGVTGHNVSPIFYPFYQSRGGFDRFGYPRTEEFVENGLLVQYFQRARLEHHPEFRTTAYEVQISLMGEWLLGPHPMPVAEPFESGPEARYFEETGHSVSYAFLRYFNNQGLDSLGFPVSEELLEHGRPVQYFQRARLEYRAEFAGTPNEVQLGLIGDEVLRQRGWLE